MLMLSPFYVAGWLAAAGVVVWRHVRAAVVTGWEDVAGPLPSATAAARAMTPEQARTPAPQKAPTAEVIALLFGAMVFVALIATLALGLLLWVGLSGQVANG